MTRTGASKMHGDAARIQKQLDRLRDRLARAWELKSSGPKIERLERLIRARWNRLEEAYRLTEAFVPKQALCFRPTPA